MTTLIEAYTDNPLNDSRTIQDNASAVGFDWPDVRGVIEKVKEEIDEVSAAVDANDDEHARRELGDVVFALVNLARFLNASLEEELHHANERFVERFARMEALIEREGASIATCSFDELNAAWDAVKRVDKS